MWDFVGGGWGTCGAGGSGMGAGGLGGRMRRVFLGRHGDGSVGMEIRCIF